MINFLMVGLMSPRVARGRLVVSLSLFLCLLFLAYCLPSGSSPGSLGFFCLFSFFKFLHRRTSLKRSSGDMSSAGSLCLFCLNRFLQRSTSLRRSSGDMSSGSGSSLVTSFGSSSESDSSSGACAPLPDLFGGSTCRGLVPRRSLIVGGPYILFLEDLFDSIPRAAEEAEEDPQGCGFGQWGVARPPKCAHPV